MSGCTVLSRGIGDLVSQSLGHGLLVHSVIAELSLLFASRSICKEFLFTLAGITPSYYRYGRHTSRIHYLAFPW